MTRRHLSLSALAASAGVALVLLTAGGTAQAHGVNWSVGIGIGLPGVVVGGGPTYYAPPPAYYVPAPRPVYYDPPPAARGVRPASAAGLLPAAASRLLRARPGGGGPAGLWRLLLP